MGLATLIKGARVKAGLTQQELAGKVSVTNAYIAQLETGARTNPSNAVIDRIASVLEIGSEVKLALGQVGHGAQVELRVYALMDVIAKRCERPPGHVNRVADNRIGNILKWSAACWLTSLEHLRFALIDFEVVRRAYLVDRQEHAKIDPSNTEATWASFYRMGRTSTLVLMRTEVFFYFGKIVIDRIADTAREYFGLPRKKFGSSHTKDSKGKDLIELIQDVGGSVPAQTVERAREVWELVGKVQKEVYEHYTDPREMRNPISYADGSVRIMKEGGIPGPNGEFGTDTPLVTEDPHRLLGLVESYMGEMADLMRLNVAKSILKGRKTA